MKRPCAYILASATLGTLYVGVTSDLWLRLSQHKQGVFEGFTKRYAVNRLVYYDFHATMTDAIGKEKRLKYWRRSWKIKLIETMNPEWVVLYDEGNGMVLDGPADVARDIGNDRPPW